MRLRARFMGMSSYYFCSDVLLELHLGSGHTGRHRITDPAAQRQQGDHNDEEQMAHGKVRGGGFLKVQFITWSNSALKTASNGAVA